MEETTTGMLQKQFEVLKFLGKGSYGSVYKVKRLSDGNTYAIKESNVKNMAQVSTPAPPGSPGQILGFSMPR
jgi:hypothetical protein